MVKGFAVNIQGAIEPLAYNNLARDLPKPRQFRDLIAHEGWIKQSTARPVKRGETIRFLLSCRNQRVERRLGAPVVFFRYVAYPAILLFFGWLIGDSKG